MGRVIAFTKLPVNNLDTNQAYSHMHMELEHSVVGDMTNCKLPGDHRVTKVSILAWLCACLLTANSCYAATPRDAYQMGLDCIASDHLVLAIDFFSQALVEKPGHIQALLRRSQAYALTNDLAKAISDCDVVLRLDPNNGEAYFQRALYRGFAGASGAIIFALAPAKSDLHKAAQLSSDKQRQAELSALLDCDGDETAGQQHVATTTTHNAALPIMAHAR